MRESSRRVLLPTLLAMTATASQAQVPRGTTLSHPRRHSNAPDHGVDGAPLTGGINFSWDTKNHGSVGLFIGSQFFVLDY